MFKVLVISWYFHVVQRRDIANLFRNLVHIFEVRENISPKDGSSDS